MQERCNSLRGSTHTPPIVTSSCRADATSLNQEQWSEHRKVTLASHGRKKSSPHTQWRAEECILTRTGAWSPCLLEWLAGTLSHTRFAAVAAAAALLHELPSISHLTVPYSSDVCVYALANCDNNNRVLCQYTKLFPFSSTLVLFACAPSRLVTSTSCDSNYTNTHTSPHCVCCLAIIHTQCLVLNGVIFLGSILLTQAVFFPLLDAFAAQLGVSVQ